MAVNQFPALAFAAEKFGHPQIERNGLCSAAQTSHGPLKANPVGQAVARRHVQDLQLILAATLKGCSVTFIPGPDGFSALAIASRWREEGGGGVVSDEFAERGSLAVHIGQRSLFTLLHELLEIMLLVIHSVSPSIKCL